MKLRNKKTGEIGNLVLNINPNRESYSVVSTENGDTVCGNLVIADYSSLAELNEEWGDYEEPKEHYFITEYGEVFSLNEYEGLNNVANPGEYKAIGNYFDTREEAEKAVEKLKALKRLENKGFKFNGWTIDDGLRVSICTNLNSDGIYDEDRKETKKDLDICFGGEDE